MLFAEDLEEGMQFDLGAMSLTEQEIVSFASQWDPLPMHTDPVAAAAGPLGGLAASGAHTLAVYVRLCSDGMVSKTAAIGGRGIRELRFHRPMRPDMEVRATSTIRSREPERAGARLVVFDGELRDGDALVCSLVGEIYIRSRGEDQSR